MIAIISSDIIMTGCISKCINIYDTMNYFLALNSDRTVKKSNPINPPNNPANIASPIRNEFVFFLSTSGFFILAIF